MIDKRIKVIYSMGCDDIEPQTNIMSYPAAVLVAQDMNCMVNDFSHPDMFAEFYIHDENQTQIYPCIDEDEGMTFTTNPDDMWGCGPFNLHNSHIQAGYRSQYETNDEIPF